MILKEHMELAGQNLIHALCPRENYLPYWHMILDNEYRGEYWFRPGCNAHNIGRWWDAMLRLEDAVGYAIPLEAEAGMLDNLWRYCDNPWGILLDINDDPDDASRWYIHSFRETMLAFNALVRFRSSRQAARAGSFAAGRMARACLDPRRWNFDTASQPYNQRHPVYTHGRAIEGLVWFGEATGDSAALELAGRLAAYHLENTTRPDGGLVEDHGNHAHSLLNTWRGLLLYGELTRQRTYIDAIEKTYRHAVAALIAPSGYLTHDIDTAQMALGDMASAGDIAQLALWLWRHTRDASMLDDVERLVRARLLPAQIVETPPVQPRQTGDQDEYRDLGTRLVGALGGAAGHTWGKSCVTDITAAVLHSLIDVYHHIVDSDALGIWVNLHFDYADPLVSLRSRRAQQAVLSLAVPGPQNLFVRLPAWAPISSVTLEVNGASSPIARHGDYVFVPGREQGLQVEMHYDLPAHVTTEKSHCQYYDTSERIFTPTPQEQEHRIAWRGDEVVGAAPVGDYFPLYPETEL